MKSLRSNPFYFKTWTATRSASGRMLIGTLICLVMCVVPYCFAAMVGGMSRGDPASMCVLVSELLLLAIIACQAAAVLHVFERERDLGTLELIALTGITVRREAWGRFAAAYKPVLDVWLLGIAPLAMAWALGHGIVFLRVWLFALVLGAGLTAFSVLCSASEDDRTSSTGLFLAAFLMVNAICLVLFKVAQAWLWIACPLSLGGVIGLAGIGETGDAVRAAPAMVPSIFVSWSVFLVGCMWALQRQIARQAPLRKARSPLAATEIVGGETTCEIRSAAVPMRNRVLEALLAPLESNPFYRSYLRGHMSAAHGYGYVTAILAVFGTFAPLAALTSFQPSAAVLACLVPLTCVAFVQALLLGQQALSDERVRSTWTVLAISGIRPETVLGGKFCAAFHALHLEWTLATAMWILVAINGHPGVIVLATVIPTAIALGVLAGLYLASQPRFLVIDVKAGLWTLAALGVAAWSAASLVHFLGLLKLLSPLDAVYNLSASTTASRDCGGPDLFFGMQQFVVQATVVAMTALALWTAAKRRMDLVLRGE